MLRERLLGHADVAYPVDRSANGTAHAVEAHGGEAVSTVEHGTHGHGHHERGAHVAHESPLAMTFPLILLSFFAIFAGFVGSPLMGNAFQRFVAGEAPAGGMNLALAGWSETLQVTCLPGSDRE